MHRMPTRSGRPPSGSTAGCPRASSSSPARAKAFATAARRPAPPPTPGSSARSPSKRPVMAAKKVASSAFLRAASKGTPWTRAMSSRRRTWPSTGPRKGSSASPGWAAAPSPAGLVRGDRALRRLEQASAERPHEQRAGSRLEARAVGVGAPQLGRQPQQGRGRVVADEGAVDEVGQPRRLREVGSQLRGHGRSLRYFTALTRGRLSASGSAGASVAAGGAFFTPKRSKSLRLDLWPAPAGCSRRKVFACSRPWPMRSPP